MGRSQRTRSSSNVSPSTRSRPNHRPAMRPRVSLSSTPRFFPSIWSSKRCPERCCRRNVRILPHVVHLMKAANLREPCTDWRYVFATGFDTSPPADHSSRYKAKKNDCYRPGILPLQKNARLELIRPKFENSSLGTWRRSREESKLLIELS